MLRSTLCGGALVACLALPSCVTACLWNYGDLAQLQNCGDDRERDDLGVFGTDPVYSLARVMLTPATLAADLASIPFLVIGTTIGAAGSYGLLDWLFGVEDYGSGTQPFRTRDGWTPPPFEVDPEADPEDGAEAVQ